MSSSESQGEDKTRPSTVGILPSDLSEEDQKVLVAPWEADRSKKSHAHRRLAPASRAPGTSGSTLASSVRSRRSGSSRSSRSTSSPETSRRTLPPLRGHLPKPKLPKKGSETSSSSALSKPSSSLNHLQKITIPVPSTLKASESRRSSKKIIRSHSKHQEKETEEVPGKVNHEEKRVEEIGSPKKTKTRSQSVPSRIFYRKEDPEYEGIRNINQARETTNQLPSEHEKKQAKIQEAVISGNEDLRKTEEEVRARRESWKKSRAGK